MTLPVVFARRATADALDAADWFDRQRRGLGTEFQEELGRTLDHIARFPQSCPPFRRSLRRALIHRFGFAVVYRIGANAIEVVAVMHCRRQAAIERRLSPPE